MKELLGEDGVTENNIMSYLGIIEQRSNELLMLFASMKTEQDGGKAATGALMAQALTTVR